MAMRTILFTEKKWQSSITAYVRVHYEDGSFRHYIQGRYGGGALTESAYDEAKPYTADAWKRYWYLPGKQGLKVEVIPFYDIQALKKHSKVG